ncbi:hypothetical protein ACMZ5F_16080 [Streptomyces rhizosphaericola]|uniref:hypothetical protein n=1 Tax=Streptomyces rhizosphaericola TaxID=2564098 RepID=UPI0039EF3BC8
MGVDMPSRRLAARLSVLTSAAAVLLTMGTTAVRAEPTPTPTGPTPSPSASESQCDLIKGLAREYCEDGDGRGGSDGAPTIEADIGDPLTSLARGFADGAGWTVDKLSDAVTATGTVDFTNGAFLTQYAIVFAASTFLVVMMWLWAAIKRVVRGVPLTRAAGEAVGLLWLAVIASAFTPLVLHVVVGAVDGITEGLAGPDNGKFFDAYSKALKEAPPQEVGGPIMQIVFSLLAILSAGVVWLELVMRTALLYAGALLGTVVYSGLVDKELWPKVRRWVGVMAAVIAVKPIIIIVLALAAAMTNGPTEDTVGGIISGFAIILIAIFASAMLFKMIPGMGDDIVAARQSSYDAASRQSVAMVTKPLGVMRQGINTHAAREASSAPQQASASSMSGPSGSSAGMSAHATRPSKVSAPRPATPPPAQSGQNTPSSTP